MANSGKVKVTLPTDEQILIKREFEAPKHLVYRAWTTPALVKRWWSGLRGEMKVVDIDLRVGGAWRYVMIAHGEFEVAFHGEYKEIVPNERLVTTEIFEGAPPPEKGQEPLNIITFSEQNGRTTLDLPCNARTRRFAISSRTRAWRKASKNKWTCWKSWLAPSSRLTKRGRAGGHVSGDATADRTLAPNLRQIFTGTRGELGMWAALGAEMIQGKRRGLSLLLVTVLSGCGDDKKNEPAAPDTRTEALTYWDDMAPLFAEHCTSCHQEGGIAPFALDDYASAKPQAALIAAVTKSREMPPWGATSDGSCQNFCG